MPPPEIRLIKDLERLTAEGEYLGVDTIASYYEEKDDDPNFPARTCRDLTLQGLAQAKELQAIPPASSITKPTPEKWRETAAKFQQAWEKAVACENQALGYDAEHTADLEREWREVQRELQDAQAEAEAQAAYWQGRRDAAT